MGDNGVRSMLVRCGTLDSDDDTTRRECPTGAFFSQRCVIFSKCQSKSHLKSFQECAHVTHCSNAYNC